MKEEDLVTGPAIATTDEMVDAVKVQEPRRILIEVHPNGALSVDLSEPFKRYELYGILADIFIDTTIKNMTIPLMAEMQNNIMQHTLNVGNQLSALIEKKSDSPASSNQDSAIISEIEKIIREKQGK